MPFVITSYSIHYTKLYEGVAKTGLVRHVLTDNPYDVHVQGRSVGQSHGLDAFLKALEVLLSRGVLPVGERVRPEVESVGKDDEGSMGYVRGQVSVLYGVQGLVHGIVQDGSVSLLGRLDSYNFV